MSQFLKRNYISLSLAYSKPSKDEEAVKDDFEKENLQHLLLSLPNCGNCHFSFIK